jgi:cullin 1
MQASCRVKVPMPIPEDRKKVVEVVNKDRRQAIEAAIVRIMKSRKTLEHSMLVPQVMQQLKRTFTADARVIKSCVEALIEKEYLERDPKNAKKYTYLA